MGLLTKITLVGIWIVGTFAAVSSAAVQFDHSHVIDEKIVFYQNSKGVTNQGDIGIINPWTAGEIRSNSLGFMASVDQTDGITRRLGVGYVYSWLGPAHGDLMPGSHSFVWRFIMPDGYTIDGLSIGLGGTGIRPLVNNFQEAVPEFEGDAIRVWISPDGVNYTLVEETTGTGEWFDSSMTDVSVAVRGSSEYYLKCEAILPQGLDNDHYAEAYGFFWTNGTTNEASAFRSEITVVPEPATLGLLALGGLVLLRRRFRAGMVFYAVACAVVAAWLALPGAAQADVVVTGSDYVEWTSGMNEMYVYTYDTSHLHVTGGSIGHVNAYGSSQVSVAGTDLLYGIGGWETTHISVSGGTVDQVGLMGHSEGVITGGQVGQLSVGEYTSGVISDGDIGGGYVFAYGVLTMEGGTLDGLDASYGGQADIHGGAVGPIEVHHGGIVAVSGGTVESIKTGAYNGTVTLSGGSIGKVELWSDQITFVGSNFVASDGAELLPDGTVTGLGTLSGQWLDGSSFSTEIIYNDPAGILYTVPEPATLSTLVLGGLVAMIRRRTMR